jgi:hypothetical protein
MKAVWEITRAWQKGSRHSVTLLVQTGGSYLPSRRGWERLASPKTDCHSVAFYSTRHPALPSNLVSFARSPVQFHCANRTLWQRWPKQTGVDKLRAYKNLYVWYLLHVASLMPRILRWLLILENICAPRMKIMITHVSPCTFMSAASVFRVKD